jgi:hypothetical protein
MVLLILALSAAEAPRMPVKVEQRARASVTILKAHRASARTWDPAGRANQREVMKKEANGEEVRLRLTEYQ